MLEIRWKLALSHADEVDTGEGAVASFPAFRCETTVSYQPLGVVTIIVPFNWPIAILGASLPHALLAGNTVDRQAAALDAARHHPRRAAHRRAAARRAC